MSLIMSVLTSYFYIVLHFLFIFICICIFIVFFFFLFYFNLDPGPLFLYLEPEQSRQPIFKPNVSPISSFWAHGDGSWQGFVFAANCTSPVCMAPVHPFLPYARLSSSSCLQHHACMEPCSPTSSPPAPLQSRISTEGEQVPAWITTPAVFFSQAWSPWRQRCHEYHTATPHPSKQARKTFAIQNLVVKSLSDLVACLSALRVV